MCRHIYDLNIVECGVKRTRQIIRYRATATLPATAKKSNTQPQTRLGGGGGYKTNGNIIQHRQSTKQCTNNQFTLNGTMLNAFWGFSVGVGAFFIGLSQISSFFFSPHHSKLWCVKIYDLKKKNSTLLYLQLHEKKLMENKNICS